MKIKWSGSVKDRMVDGKGMGYVMEEDVYKRFYHTVIGTFNKGIPVGEVTYAVGTTRNNDADRDVKMEYKLQATVSPYYNGVAYITKDHKNYGFINASGELINALEYNGVKVGPKENQFIVKYSNMDIVIDHHMQFVGIADGVTEIPNWYFNKPRFDGLTSITIPASVTKIGTGVFAYRKQLAEVKILSTSYTVEDRAFEGCTSLEAIDLSAYNNAIIGAGTFKNCTSMRSIILPSRIETIGEGAFNGCTSLTSASIFSTLTDNIKGNAIFASCGSLKNVTVRNSNNTEKQSNDWYWFKTTDPNAPEPVYTASTSSNSAPSIDPNSSAIPDYKLGDWENEYGLFSNKVKYKKRQVYFDYEWYGTIEYRPDMSRDSPYKAFGVGFYKTLFDAVAALYFYKKYKLERTAGRY